MEEGTCHTAQEEKSTSQEAASLQREPSWLPANVQIVDIDGEEKMSKMLVDLVEPFLSKNISSDGLRNLFGMGAIAWNAALLPAKERSALLEAHTTTIPPEIYEEVFELINALIDRKLELFPNKTRAVLDFSLTSRSTGPYLEVISSLPNDSVLAHA